MSQYEEETGRIMKLAESLTSSRVLAREWFEKTAIPGWADKTAQELVQDGKADRVLEYLEASRSGVYG